MIHSDSRSMDWINEVSSRYPSLDKTIIEKTIRAFSLLESLALSGCPFIFKGGTATMLHLDSSRRLSIDIDIICPPGTDIAQYVKSKSEDYDFVDIELVERKAAHNVPKSHAKFYYQVSYVTNKQTDKILLDVLFEDNHYGKIEKSPIRSPFLKTYGEDVLVNIPSAADILGDKLTAFAPHTSGIPFFKHEKNCSLEVMKQLFDIASLFDIVTDFEQVTDTFFRFAEVELGYRYYEIPETAILDDVIDTALCVTLRGLHNPSEFTLIQGGIKRLAGIVVCERYMIDMAIRDAAKAAYLAAMIKYERTDIRKYDASANAALASSSMTKLTTKLNKLKKTAPEAFYYWNLVDKLLDNKLSGSY